MQRREINRSRPQIQSVTLNTTASQKQPIEQGSGRVGRILGTEGIPNGVSVPLGKNIEIAITQKKTTKDAKTAEDKPIQGGKGEEILRRTKATVLHNLLTGNVHKDELHRRSSAVSDSAGKR